MFDVGGGELIIILLFVLLLFGPKKIPEFAQMVGKGLRKFRMAQEELTQQIRDISAEAAITEDQIGRKASTPTPINVTQPIVVPAQTTETQTALVPKPAVDTVSRQASINRAVFGEDPSLDFGEDNRPSGEAPSVEAQSDDRKGAPSDDRKGAPSDDREGSPS